MSVQGKATKLGLRRERSFYWLAKQINLLKKLYGNIPDSKIANKLNKSIYAIRQKAYLSGLGKKR